VRTVFIFTLGVIVAGLVFYSVVGFLHL